MAWALFGHFISLWEGFKHGSFRSVSFGFCNIISSIDSTSLIQAAWLETAGTKQPGL